MLHTKDCGFYIKHISEILQRDANNELRSAGLTVTQVTVLHLLQNAPNGELSLKELEKQLLVAQPTAAGIVIRLEQKGFVESFGRSDDKRIKMIRLTAAGRACCAQSQNHIAQTEERLLSALTESERAHFIALPKKVSDSLK